MRAILLLFIAGCTVTMLRAQAPQSTHWFTVQLPVVLNSNWQVVNEISYRSLRESASMNQLFVRTGARYIFNEQWNVAVCGDLVFTRISPDKTEDHFGREKRLWQEVVYQAPAGKSFFLSNRIRVEERFFDATSKKEAFNAMRFRYRVGVQKEINEDVRIQLADEIMTQLQDKLTFNQNRVIAGVSFETGANSTLQTNYMWSKLPAGSQHSMVIIFQKRIVLHAKGPKS